MPFSLMMISYLVWGFISLRNKNKRLVMIKATSTVVILLFLVHPNLVNYIFNVFK